MGEFGGLESRNFVDMYHLKTRTTEVVVYEVSTGERLRRLGRHKDTPLALGFSPSGEYLATWIQLRTPFFVWNLGGG